MLGTCGGGLESVRPGEAGGRCRPVLDGQRLQRSQGWRAGGAESPAGEEGGTAQPFMCSGWLRVGNDNFAEIVYYKVFLHLPSHLTCDVDIIIPIF